jgi:hypothetical protein
MTAASPVEPDQITAVLRPPYIPGMTELPDQPPYDGGIPLRAVEGDLQVIINAWQTMNIGDRVEMFWANNSAPVWSKTIELESELNKDVVFRIPEGFILDGDATPVFYRVTRPTQGPQSSTPILTLLVKRTRPGGLDDSPEPGHDGLKYTLTPDVSNGVDPGMAEQGVQMRIEPYENITVYDRVIARWGSQEVVHYPVTQQQIDDPNNHPILITFTKAVIEAAGDGPRVAVTYQVIDRCNNYPDERAPWAAYTYVLVDLGGNRLNAPLVLVEGRPTNTVDLDVLGEADVVVRVYTPETDFAIEDRIAMTWSGTPAEGGPIVVGPLEQTVEFVPFQCDFLIPNASVKAIAKGWATVSYMRLRDGVANRPSKDLSVDVVGDISHLLPPSVDEAPNGTLPPETLWATVKLPWYPGRKSSDQVTLIWEASRPGSGTVYYEDARPVGDVPEHEPILRSVSNAEILRFDGLNVKVYYRVANDDALIRSVRESQALWMQVGDMLRQFVRPEVDEKEPTSNVLDPDKVPFTGATLVVPHLDTLPNDIVNYLWRGSAIDGSTRGSVELTTQTAGKPVKFTVDKRYVILNLDGMVIANYSVIRDGVELGHSLELSLRIGHVRPEICSVKDPASVEIPHGGNTVHTSVVFSGIATPNQKVEIVDGIASHGAADVSANGDWTKTLNGLTTTSHSFTAKALYGGGLVSIARTFTTRVELKPEITAVATQFGQDILDGGYTIERSLDIRGTGTEGLEVELFDGLISKGKATTVGGQSRIIISGLSVGFHSLTLKALYGERQVSAARTFTISEEVRPAITYIATQFGNDIEEGTTTTERNFKLVGSGAVGMRMEVFDGGVFMGVGTAYGDVWVFNINNLSDGLHRLTARGNYLGGGLWSLPRTFTIVAS